MNYIFNRSWKGAGERMFSRVLMPAKYEDIRENLGEIFERWDAVCEQYSPVTKLLRSSFFQPGPSFIEDRFLTIAQAIEGFCRINAKERLLDDELFYPIRDDLLSRIPPDCPSGFLELSKLRINALNEYSLRDRLRSLFTRHTWLKAFLTGPKHEEPNESDVDKFIGRVVSTRNKLTHVESGKGREIKVDYTTYWQLRAVLCAMLLFEAGVRSDESQGARNSILYQTWWA